jgi:hypothetical protein
MGGQFEGPRVVQNCLVQLLELPCICDHTYDQCDAKEAIRAFHTIYLVATEPHFTIEVNIVAVLV